MKQLHESILNVYRVTCAWFLEDLFVFQGVDWNKHAAESHLQLLASIPCWCITHAESYVTDASGTVSNEHRLAPYTGESSTG